MGKPMAMNIVKKSGAEVAVHAVDQGCYEEMRRAGADTVAQAHELRDAEVIILCLPSGDVVRSVLLGKQGLLARLEAGQMIIDTSTIDYSTTLELNEALSAAGVEFLDAPVSGMEARAIEGTLTVMCGGDRETFNRAESILQCFGNNILYMGGAGSGQLTKLINQLLFDINCAALAEILPMAVKMGLDAQKVGSVVNSGTGRSYASEFFVPRILKNDFSSGYPLRHAYKDLVSAAELGARRCVPMPVLAAATATYQAALLNGHGALDKGSMILPFEELLGVKFRSAA
jgi:3-hydroxyisobutyrate dehydrogenase-like beta-hydroxyacid dehydrogenase